MLSNLFRINNQDAVIFIGKWKVLVTSIVIVLNLLPFQVQALLLSPAKPQLYPADLVNIVQATGKTRLIIGLTTSFQPEGELRDRIAINTQRRLIASTQQLFLTTLNDALVAQGIPIVTPKRTFSSISYLVMEVDDATLQKILENPYVASIEIDELSRPSLVQSVPIIQADMVWAQGYTGNGQTIAVIDSGVDKTHPALTGKIIAEACYSTNSSSPDYSATTLCPNGLEEQKTVGAGISCDSNISKCDHGTHVTGIVAANGTVTGVAKGANIIAIQVFSLFESTKYCGSKPCILSFKSNQVSALEYVLAQQQSGTHITAINMSLGGGKYSTSCDSEQPALRDIINNLYSVGIITVASSGNNEYTNGINWPACISAAISVGATRDSDTIPSFSNSANILDLLAPGDNIVSTIPEGGISSKDGTSMAAPHVASAWAVLKSAVPTANIEEISYVLIQTGKPITDSRNGMTKPRINLVDALALLLANTAPTISDVTVQTIDEDTATAPISFTIGDTETAAADLVMSGSSNDTTLVPHENITFGGNNENRTVTITPASQQAGTATITITVIDTGYKTADDSFTLTVNAINDEPTVSDIANQSTDEDIEISALGFTIDDVETDAASLNLSASSDNTTLVPNGNITFSGSDTNRTLTITPATHQSGTATITVTVSDGTDTANDSFLLTVNAVNDAPTVPINTGITLAEGDIVTLTNSQLNANDIEDDNNTLVYKLTQVPSHGTLKNNGAPLAVNDTFTQTEINNNQITYEHDDGEMTADSFQFTVKDNNNAQSAETSFNFTITPVNDAPTVTTNTGFTLAEGSLVTLTNAQLNANDVDDDNGTLIYTLIQAPNFGSLEKSGTTLVVNNTFSQDELDNNKIAYQHDGSETTADSFQLTVKDNDDAKTAETSFDLTITSVNDAPTVPINTGITLAEGDTVILTNTQLSANDDDDDNDILVYKLTQLPSHGTLKNNGAPLAVNDTFTQTEINNNQITYEHDDGETTADSFQFIVKDDDNAQSAETSFNFTITPVNDAPTVTTNIGLTLAEGSLVTLTNAQLNANDVDDDNGTLIYTLIQAPNFGSLEKSGTTLVVNNSFTQDELDNNKITYQHDGSETTADSFQLTIKDDEDAKTVETSFDFTITSVNDAPTVPINTGITLAEGDTVTVSNTQLNANDVDDNNNLLVYILTQIPSEGTLKKDGIPLAVNGTFTQQQLDNHKIIYQHNDSETSTDTFQFIVKDDDNAQSAETGFNFTITPVNDVPTIIINTGAPLTEGTTVTLASTNLTAYDSDDNNSTLIYTLTQVPNFGSLEKSGTTLVVNNTFSQDELDNNKIAYQHDGSETTTDNFRFTVKDDEDAKTAESIFPFAITLVNDIPAVTNNTGITLAEGGTVTLSLAELSADDNDDDNNNLIYTLTQIPSVGALKKDGIPLAINGTFTQQQLDSGKITYQHNGSETTADTFQFLVKDDENAQTMETTFSFTITPVNDVPAVVINEELKVGKATSIIITTPKLYAEDADDDDNTLVYTITQLPTHGVLKNNNTPLILNGTFSQNALLNNQIVYQHDGSDTVSDNFKTIVTDDDNAQSSEITFQFLIQPVNTVPTLVDVSKVALTNTTLSMALSDFSNSFADDDNHSLAKIKITTLPSNGILKLNNVAVSLHQEMNANDISKLTYIPNTDTKTDSFVWQAHDGIEYSTTEALTNITYESTKLIITETGGATTLSEGGATDTIALTLNLPPLTEVTVTITPDQQCQVTPTTLTFNPSHWNVAQSITITAQDDTKIENNHTCLIQFNGSGGSYNGTTNHITAQITDNDASSPPPTSSGGGTPPLPAKMTLALQFTGNGYGQVKSKPTGINCRRKPDTPDAKECKHTYDTATWVNLTATAASNSEFQSWTGASDCIDGRVFLVRNLSCQAHFTLKPQTLTIPAIEHGTVVSIPQGIACGSNGNQCTYTFEGGTEIKLVVIPDKGWESVGWEGACDDMGSITMLESADCQPQLATIPKYNLTVTKTGKGTVTSQPSGIACGEDCTENYQRGSFIWLTAIPAPGFRFSQWTETCAPTPLSPVSESFNPNWQQELEINLDTPTSCTAIFKPACPTTTRLYVNQQALGNQTGCDWTNALTNLSTALQLIHQNDLPNVKEIWVAKGTYQPTSSHEREISLQLINGVAIYGGFVGTETQRQQRDMVENPTILSGDIGILDDHSDNSFHVITSTNNDATAILDGFTITGGNANQGEVCPSACGGGVFNDNSSPTLVNLLLTDNSAIYGGAIYNRNNSNPTLKYSHLFNNTAQQDGGAIVNNNTNPLVMTLNLTDNSGLYEGLQHYYPIISHSLITANQATNGGGMVNSYSQALISHLVFSDNLAHKVGGALLNHESQLIVSQTTVSGNQATEGSGFFNLASQLTVNNSILWENHSPDNSQIVAQILDDVESHSTVNYSIIQGGWQGTGNQNQDINPLFIQTGSPAIADFRLSSNSPAIDAGNNDLLPANWANVQCQDFDGNTTKKVGVDLDCQPRLMDGNGDGIITVDMGAYEALTLLPVTEEEPLPVETPTIEDSTPALLPEQDSTPEQNSTPVLVPEKDSTKDSTPALVPEKAPTPAKNPAPALVPIDSTLPPPPLPIDNATAPMTTVIGFNIHACPTGNNLNWVCNANGRTITENFTVEKEGNLSNAVLASTLLNKGRVSRLTITSQGQLRGGIVSGYINNAGTMADFEFVGSVIKGGTLAGTILNNSQVGGYFQDVQLAKNAHIKGGKLMGKIQGNAEAPALLENLTIQPGSHLSNVMIGDGVTLPDKITLGENVTFLNSAPKKSATSPQPNCQSNGLAIKIATNQLLDSQTCFSHQIKTHDGLQPNNVTLTQTQAKQLKITGKLTVEPKHAQKPAELLIVGIHQSYPTQTAYMRTETHWQNWNGELKQLQVAKSYQQLPNTLEITLFQGDLSSLPGEFTLFLGYRTTDGTIIYNGKEPWHFLIK